jgi:hypothetical protein
VSDEIMDDVGGEADEVVEDVADEGGDEVLAEGGDEGGEHREPVPDPAKAKAKPAEPPKPARTYKVKVNGREQEIPADDVEKAAQALGVEVDALLGGTRMFRAANEKFQSAAQIEKQAKALQEKLKTSPREALREVLGEEGFSKLAIEAVQEMMQAETLTPEQRRIKELEAAQAKVQAEKAEQAKAREAEQAQRYEGEVAQRLDTEITAALTSGKLPKDPYVVKRLAAMVDAHLARGGNPDELSFTDFVPLVQDEIKREHEAFLGKLTGEDVITRFPALAEKVRKAYAARVSGRRAVPEQATEGRPRSRETKTYGSISAVLRDM